MSIMNHFKEDNNGLEESSIEVIELELLIDFIFFQQSDSIQPPHNFTLYRCNDAIAEILETIKALIEI
jgi:hypothetical protein